MASAQNMRADGLCRKFRPDGSLHDIADQNNSLIIIGHALFGDIFDALRRVHNVSDQRIVDAPRGPDVSHHCGAGMYAYSDSHGWLAEPSSTPIVTNDRGRDRSGCATGSGRMIQL